jgi:peptidoglycan/xylan/chitin deacetylase (PgdA/CDA1 family)
VGKGRRWKRRIKLTLIILVAIVFSILAIVYFQPLFVVKWLARQNPEVLYFVDTESRVVALTIDDAPHPVVTPQILDVLKQNSAHATFFLIGENIKGNEHLLDRMRQEGHELGNHLATDAPSIRLSPEEFERQLIEVDEMIKVEGSQKWFRPGSGFYNTRMLKQAELHGYRCSLGSVYPHDTAVRNTWIISKFITQKVFPGAIIIIHDGKDNRIRSVEVLKRVLPELKNQGYQVVTLSELVSAGKK